MALELLQDHLVEPGQPLDVVGVVGFVGSVGLLEVPLLSLFEELLCFSPTRVRPIQPYRYRYGLSESYRYRYRKKNSFLADTDTDTRCFNRYHTDISRY